ncbi:MAG: GNAT family N-acetyltransferase [Croceitalea sp.]|nr:GNAT family N-acetyltransferase [Croceitalea sp.]NNM16977.1 GNAT family N-acetyltransferase [Croceitalea sp.]
MLNLIGQLVYLRALEPSDIDFLYALENDTKIWEISGTIAPYSKAVLEMYLDNAHRDIYEVKQLRLVICDKNDEIKGLVDLFDFDPKNKRVGVGIVVSEEKDRNKGYGEEALRLCCSYVLDHLDMHQIYANIIADNEASIRLFEKLGFEEVGLKKDWICSNSSFKSEHLYQKIKGK